MQDFESTVEVLDQGRAAFDPVAVVGIENLADAPDFGVVDVTADDAVQPAAACHFRHRLFEVGDVADSVFDSMLEVG